MNFGKIFRFVATFLQKLVITMKYKYLSRPQSRTWSKCISGRWSYRMKSNRLIILFSCFSFHQKVTLSISSEFHWKIRYMSFSNITINETLVLDKNKDYDVLLRAIFSTIFSKRWHHSQYSKYPYRGDWVNWRRGYASSSAGYAQEVTIWPNTCNTWRGISQRKRK